MIPGVLRALVRMPLKIANDEMVIFTRKPKMVIIFFFPSVVVTATFSSLLVPKEPLLNFELLFSVETAAAAGWLQSQFVSGN